MHYADIEIVPISLCITRVGNWGHLAWIKVRVSTRAVFTLHLTVCVCVFIVLLCVFLHFVVPMGISPLGNLGKQLQQSHDTQP